MPHYASGCSSGKDNLLTARPGPFNLHSAAVESLLDTHTHTHSRTETLEMASPWESEEVDGSNLLSPDDGAHYRCGVINARL